LGWDGKQRTEVTTPKRSEADKDHDERFVVSTQQGKINIKRVVDLRDEGQGFWMVKDDPRLRFNTITDQDPFAEPDQAIAWLLTDDYSPLYLDRSLPYKLHPSFYKTDSDDSYFRGDYQPGDLYPRFACDAILRHDPRLAERVNWRAAFHDLLEVHHKGTLATPSLSLNPACASASADPGRWISHLVDTGSLGSKWRKLATPDSTFGPCRFRYGNSSETWAVSSFLGRRFVREALGRTPIAEFGSYERKNDSLALISASTAQTPNATVPTDPFTAEQNKTSELVGLGMHLDASEATKQVEMMEEALDNEWHSYRPGFTKSAISLIRNPGTQQSMLRAVDRVLRVIENPELEDEVEEILSEAIGGIDLKSPKKFTRWLNEVDHLLREDYYEEWKAAKKAVDSEHHDVYGVRLNDPEDGDLSSSSTSSSDCNSSSFSSSSSSSSSSPYTYNHDSTTDDSPNSIISRLTTVESRTLPDGRIETKRVLKKRFADGREENSEIIETQPARGLLRAAEEFIPRKAEAKVEARSESPSGLAQGKQKTGGWFWN
jgi:hypothetical protein